MTPAPDAARVEAIRRAMAEILRREGCSVPMIPTISSALAALVASWVGPLEEGLVGIAQTQGGGASYRATEALRTATLPWRQEEQG